MNQQISEFSCPDKFFGAINPADSLGICQIVQQGFRCVAQECGETRYEFVSNVILKPAKSAHKSINFFRKVFALFKCLYPLQVDGLCKQRTVSVSKVPCFSFCQLQRQQGAFNMFRQVGKAHKITPVRFAMLKTGASRVRASLSKISSLRSP